MAVQRQAVQPAARRIVRDPNICGGDPTIEGTRVPITSLVVAYDLYRDLGQIRTAYPQVEIPTIMAALAFYEAHRQEIDALIELDEREAAAAD